MRVITLLKHAIAQNCNTRYPKLRGRRYVLFSEYHVSDVDVPSTVVFCNGTLTVLPPVCTKKNEFIRFCRCSPGITGQIGKTMVLLDSFLRSALCASCFFCVALRLSKSEGDSDDEAEIVGNVSSQEQHVLPTPLITHLNRSTAQLLIQEANSMFVSNTSLSDLANDNETQQMLLRYRERKRQVRILTIQREILQKLGLTSGPNVTARLSAEERQTLVRSFDKTMGDRVDVNSDNETVCVGATNDEIC